MTPETESPMRESARGKNHHARPGGAGEEFEAVTVSTVHSLAEIESLEADWRRLTAETAAPFQTFSWNLAWYRNFAAAYDAAVVFVVKREGIVVAILPCYRKGRMFRLAGDLSCDYQDILAASVGDAVTGIEAISGSLLEEAPGCRFFFEKLSSEGLLRQALQESKFVSEEMITAARRYAPCPFVGLSGGLDAYLDSLPSRRRQDMRRCLKRFAQTMPASRVQVQRNLEIRVHDLEGAVTFHIEHFRKSGVSPLAHEALVRTLGEVSKDPDVGFQLSNLSDQGDVIAVDFGFARGGRYYGYLTGFDPAFREFAPGKCLLLRRIDSWVEKDGVQILDFLAGDEPYKLGFTHGESYFVESVHLMPNRVGHRARRMSILANYEGRRIAKDALQKVALPR